MGETLICEIAIMHAKIFPANIKDRGGEGDIERYQVEESDRKSIHIEPYSPGGN